MGTYLSIPLYSRNTVTLEPIVKKADTEAVQSATSSAPSKLQNIAKVIDTTSPNTSNQVELSIPGEKKEIKEEPKEELKKEPVEPKKEFLEFVDSSKKVDLIIVKKEEPLAVEPQNVEAEPKKYTKIQIIEEDNVLLLSSDELKQRILGMADDVVKQQKETVRVLHKKMFTELLDKVQHSKNDSDEDTVPLSREELQCRVLRELENHSKKSIINNEDKMIKPYVKDIPKEKVKTPLLEPVKEETVQDVHPYLLEYGVNPVKTNTLLIQNHTYQKIDASVAPVAAPVVAPVAAPVAPVTAPTHAQNNHKKNKKKKH
jgi:hypothetical protein